jgi:hypothetical protein
MVDGSLKEPGEMPTPGIGRVAAGRGEAGDETKLDRVTADTEDDRACRCCSFGHERGRGDHCHLSANQIGPQRRPAIVLAPSQWYSTVTFRPSTRDSQLLSLSQLRIEPRPIWILSCASGASLL